MAEPHTHTIADVSVMCCWLAIVAGHIIIVILCCPVISSVSRFRQAVHKCNSHLSAKLMTFIDFRLQDHAYLLNINGWCEVGC